MSSVLSGADWEGMFAPYDQSTYQAVLDLLRPEDIVLDIGAGDLVFSRQMARIAKIVYAVEVHDSVLEQGLSSCEPLPDNLIAIHADARTFDFPTGITVGVLLMRHCTHFRLYSEKLRFAGAERLITNARWHMSAEQINLQMKRTSFQDVLMGWYACLCGATGFKIGTLRAEDWSAEMDQVIYEVNDCPQCK
jgi:hypothetical protein